MVEIEFELWAKKELARKSITISPAAFRSMTETFLKNFKHFKHDGKDEPIDLPAGNDTLILDRYEPRIPSLLRFPS